jgi:ubiquinone/menaquinone biosynthesis C-methylase UbiE
VGGIQDARDAWDRRAESDLYSSIESSRRDWTTDEFYADGRQMVEQAMEWLGNGVERGRMLEVGCGAGRTAVPFAQVFGLVEGVDISPRMIDAAVEQGLPPNVHLQATDGESLAPFGDASFDFVFSEHVFQHIASEAVIGRYLREVGRVLKPGGVALLQFDTRRKGLAAALYNLVPARFLPRKRREYMRRYRRTPAWVRAAAESAGLAAEWEQGEGTHWHWFMLRTAPRSLSA